MFHSPPSKQYVKALEARVESLEKRLKQLGEPTQSFEPEIDLDFDDNEIQQGVPIPIIACPISPTEDQAREPVEELADILGRFNIGDGGEVCYFGSRSNFNLLRGSMTNTLSSYRVRKRGYEAAQRQVGLVDVTPDLQDHLLDLFWRWQNTWQFIISEPLFKRDLNKNSGSFSAKFYSPLLLSAIFALASRYSDRPEVRTNPDHPVTAGDKFAAQAKVMLQYECEAPTTLTVQATALLALRETALDKEALGWMYCGMASRMALNLGLHLDCSLCIEHGLLTKEEVESRKMAWWGCYVLDKYTSTRSHIG